MSFEHLKEQENRIEAEIRAYYQLQFDDRKRQFDDGFIADEEYLSLIEDLNETMQEHISQAFAANDRRNMKGLD